MGRSNFGFSGSGFSKLKRSGVDRGSPTDGVETGPSRHTDGTVTVRSNGTALDLNYHPRNIASHFQPGIIIPVIAIHIPHACL